jgi:hypothetical protein
MQHPLLGMSLCCRHEVCQIQPLVYVPKLCLDCASINERALVETRGRPSTSEAHWPQRPDTRFESQCKVPGLGGDEGIGQARLMVSHLECCEI